MASSLSLPRKRPRRTSPANAAKSGSVVAKPRPACADDEAMTQAMGKMSDAICVVRIAELVLDDNSGPSLFDVGEAGDALRALNVDSALAKARTCEPGKGGQS